MDQRNVSLATEMAKLTGLFYESKRDENPKGDARRNFDSRGNQHFKTKNFSIPNVNSEPNKNGDNGVSGTGSQSGWLRSRWLPKFGVFIAKCQITKDLNVPDCSEGRTTVQELG